MRKREKSSKTPRILAYATKLENKEEIKNSHKIISKMFRFKYFSGAYTTKSFNIHLLFTIKFLGYWNYMCN